ncbi:MAG: XkdX family protein [Firmicutes bacterium]|nr:XkdX family protein [Bacillota bacterium]
MPEYEWFQFAYPNKYATKNQIREAVVLKKISVDQYEFITKEKFEDETNSTICLESDIRVDDDKKIPFLNHVFDRIFKKK